MNDVKRLDVQRALSHQLTLTASDSVHFSSSPLRVQSY